MNTIASDDTAAKALPLAGEILRNTVTTLLLNLRFLESALFRLHPEPARTTFATNGQQLYYGFEFLFTTYRSDVQALNRGYLHTLMHCLFRHPFVAGTVDRELWDLACDIAVEAAIEDLDLKSVETARGRSLAPHLARLKKSGIRLTAERLYHYFITHPKKREDFLDMTEAFAFCDHSPWYSSEEEKQNSEAESSGSKPKAGTGKPDQDPGDGDEKGESSVSEENSDSEDPEGSSDSDNNQDDENRNGDGNGESSEGQCRQNTQSSQEAAALKAQWEDISRRVQMDLEAFGKQQGDKAGSLTQELRALNREHYDYRSFLLKFAALQEVMKINDDEFDYIFYTYGLDLYENMPLIEPLEYKEDPRIREFVIAIDTSGSTAGDLVQTFLQKTFNILKSTETFASRMRLRIIQCDCRIQESVLLETEEEFDAYIKRFRIKGQGGTDFRPVFEHVNELVANGELLRLKGLIYFTDGYGTFPKQKPSYDAAFVFVRPEDTWDPPRVPPWAIKLVLDPEEVAGI